MADGERRAFADGGWNPGYDGGAGEALNGLWPEEKWDKGGVAYREYARVVKAWNKSLLHWREEWRLACINKSYLDSILNEQGAYCRGLEKGMEVRVAKHANEKKDLLDALEVCRLQRDAIEAELVQSKKDAAETIQYLETDLDSMRALLQEGEAEKKHSDGAIEALKERVAELEGVELELRGDCLGNSYDKGVLRLTLNEQGVYCEHLENELARSKKDAAGTIEWLKADLASLKNFLEAEKVRYTKEIQSLKGNLEDYMLRFRKEKEENIVLKRKVRDMEVELKSVEWDYYENKLGEALDHDD